MKLYIWIAAIILLSGSQSAYGQSTLFKEWFQQKKTQKEYLINQIVALQAYIEVAKKGYEIYDKGLNLIGRIKDGEFSLHNDFFLSLKGINPEIARYARVADIIQLQVRIAKRYSSTMKHARKGPDFSAREVSYLDRVFNRLLDDCVLLVDELIELTTSGKLELEDDQRLQRIDQLYAEMQDKYDFAERFGSEVILLGYSRATERANIETGKNLNNQKTD